jgi:hypothetical protein
MMSVKLVDEALDEMREAAAYYELQREGLGQEFLDEVLKTISRIRFFPNGHPRVSEHSRRCRLDRFPYGLVYQVFRDEHGISVIAVMQLNRRPDYWKDREAR